MAPGGDVEPWALLDEAEGVQMELVINNPSAEPSALDAVRDAMQDMHRDGVAGSPTDPDDRSTFLPAAATDQAIDPNNGLVEVIPVGVAAPSSAEGLLRTAVLAGRQATAEDDPGLSAPEDPWQPLAASPLGGGAGATTKPGTVEQPVHGPRDEPTPQNPKSQKPPPAVDVADDFGPLTTVTSPKRQRRSPRRGWLIGGAAILVTTLLVGVGIAALTDDQDGQAPASAANGDSMPQTTAPDVTWRTWRGMKLPVSVRSGPDSWTADGDRVSGFAHSQLGAAIAAANLSVRVDPAAGETAWRAVLRDHAVGDSSRLEAALEAADTTKARDAGEPGVLTGWRLSGDPAAGKVVVHLAVGTDGGSAQDFAIPLAWQDGDWALNIPGASEPIFAVTDTDGPYAAFQGEQ